MAVGAVTLLGALGSLLGIVVWSAGSYNSLVRLRELVTEAWQQIERELDRRLELVPDLVKGLRAHVPQNAVQPVLRARARVRNAGRDPRTRAPAENELIRALAELLRAAENRPALDSDQGFQALRCELASIEDRIAASRRFYNASADALNARVRGRSRLTAILVGIRRADSFEGVDGCAAWTEQAR
ncbi:MAG: LemA protein [Actinomycetota bacterium]|nr:LemA protein [Actinomycetota bacterium]